MFRRGTQISGFTLVRRLGAGGMGEIWEVVRREGEVELRAALKVANPDILAIPEGRALFEREASLSASLRHPNIASVLTADLAQGHIFYELVDGADLRTVLNEGAGNRLSLDVLVSVLYQICRGLSHAHRRQVQGELSPVIHRDMSPGNVVIDYDGNVKVVDFGIAKAIAQSERSEIVKGKLNYMAPEQATAGAVDSRTDQYAVAVIAYEAIAGQRPNDGAHEGETLHNILEGKHLPIQQAAPHVPAGLASTIERMLAVEPEDRFPSMDAVVDALEPFTPPLGVHRELAALVHKARPRHTILFRDGQYVSVPIAHAQRDERTGSVPPPGRHRRNSVYPKTVPLPPEPIGQRARVSTPDVRPIPVPLVQPVRPARPSAPAKPRNPIALATAGALLAASVLGGAMWLIAPTDEAPWSTATAEDDPGTGAAEGNSIASVEVSAVMRPERAIPGASNGNATEDDSPGAEPSELETGNGTPTYKLTALPPTAAAMPAQKASRRSGPTATEAKPSRPKPREPSRSASRAAAPQNESPRERGTLHVGVFPPTNVWVDGRLRGRSPLSIELRPGRHIVGAGERDAVITRRVTVSENETTKIFLELGNQPATPADSP